MVVAPACSSQNSETEDEDHKDKNELFWLIYRQTEKASSYVPDVMYQDNRLIIMIM